MHKARYNLKYYLLNFYIVRDVHPTTKKFLLHSEGGAK